MITYSSINYGILNLWGKRQVLELAFLNIKKVLYVDRPFDFSYKNKQKIQIKGILSFFMSVNKQYFL